MSEVIIYNRTSTEEQNPENQLEDCKSINKFGEPEVIEDTQSAWKDNVERYGFNELKAKIKSGNVRHLIVWDLDRIYRNRNKLKEFFQFCKAYNCQIHSYRQSWLEEINLIPQPWNEIVYELLINIFGWLAQDESDKKSKRVKAAIRIKNHQKYSYKGKKWGRKAISKQKERQVREMANTTPKLSYRAISEAVGVSLGTVHKLLAESKREKQSN